MESNPEPPAGHESEDYSPQSPADNGWADADSTIETTKSAALHDTFLRTTMGSEHFEEALEKPEILLHFDDLEGGEDVVFNIVATARDAEADGDEADFRIVTDDITLDMPGIKHDALNVANRYDVIKSIGTGSYGQVFSVFDNNLQREIATKFLHPKKARTDRIFRQVIREARVTASLSHPNILPIYDVGVSDGGLPYFTMREMLGSTLADLITLATRQKTPELDSFYDRATIISKICDAVAYAHDIGVIHQDIKPDNIVIGRFGEAMLIDWGTAVTIEERGQGEVRIQGTPAYMSPEQARRDYADERSDIYCIGATLFHLLTLRLPVTISNPDEFWEIKRRGDILPPTSQERLEIPGPLLAIALRAMAADPSQRYASVADMGKDLHRFQAGLSIEAYQDSLGDMFRRLYRRHTGTVWTAAAAALLLIILGTLLFIEKQREYSRWHTITTENFDTTSRPLKHSWQAFWFEDWVKTRATVIPLEGDNAQWAINNGTLHFTPDPTHTTGACNLSYKTAIPGNLSVSWEVTPITRGLDLNCFIAGRNRFSGYTFHIGGWENHYRIDCTSHTGSQDELLIDRTMLTEPIRAGTTYQITMERVEDRVRLYFEGNLVIDAQDSAPLVGSDNQFFGFETSNTELRIDNLVVRQQHLPELVPAISIADGLLAEGHYQQALDLYRSISGIHGHDSMTVQATYRAARCQASLGNWQEARSLLHAFLIDYPNHELRHIARSLLLECQLSLDLEPAAVALMQDLADDPDTPENVARVALIRFVNHIAKDVVQRNFPLNAQEEYRHIVESWDRWRHELNIEIPLLDVVFSAMTRMIDAGEVEEIRDRFPKVDEIQAYLLYITEEYEEVVRRYPHIERFAEPALLALNRPEDVLASNPDNLSRYAVNAMMALGRIDELLAHPTLSFRTRINILCTQSPSRLEEARALAPDHPVVKVLSGDYENIDLKRYAGDSTWSEIVLLQHGILEPILALPWHEREAEQHFARFILALRELQAGERKQALERLHFLADVGRPLFGEHIFSSIMLPATIALVEGNTEACREQLLQDRQRKGIKYSNLRYFLDAVNIEKPLPPKLTDELNDTDKLLLGIHHELNGRPTEARAAYQAIADNHPTFFNEYPTSIDPATQAFVLWRLKSLPE